MLNNLNSLTVPNGGELIVENGQDYYVINRISNATIGIKLSTNKSSTILFTTTFKRKAGGKVVFPKLTFKNKIGIRKLYSNYGIADDGKGSYELSPDTTYEISIRVYSKICVVKFQALDKMSEAPASTDDSSSSSLSDSSFSEESSFNS